MSLVHRLRETRAQVGVDAGGGVFIEPLRRRHLRAILPIENQVYPKPWTPGVFQSEIDQAREGWRHYVIARMGNDLVGYAGLLFSGDDAHITNIAVDPMLQGHGIAHRLLAEQIDAARELGGSAVSLEVRVTNWRAQRIYARFGFHPVGIRRNYYAELHEDALIMWTDDVRERAYRRRLNEIVQKLPEGIRPQAGTL